MISVTRCRVLRFPHWYKYAKVTPLYKKEDKADKENLSILLNLAKVYERLMCKHI